MHEYLLKIRLISDAIFGRGDGVAGLVDIEVQHDEYGCPFLNGRTLRGLLVEECANILHAMQLQGKGTTWTDVYQRLFGNPGSRQQDMAILRVGIARLPADVRQAIRASIDSKKMTPQQILNSLTAIDRQTAINSETGAPEKGALRSSRVILRNTIFISKINFLETPESKELALLSACISALRRAGSSRNRGRGELQASLLDLNGNDLTRRYLDIFKKEMEADQ